jgi:hypothetical protein
MLTHKSSERDLQAAVEEAKKMDVVSSVRLIRIEGSL